MKRLWVTRAAPGAEETAVRLRALGFEPLVAPLLEVRPTGAAVDLNGVDALAFTSGNGVRAFAAASPARALPVFAVGGATARAAREAGFAHVISADAEVESLAALIASRADGIVGAVLHPGAAEPAGDLVGALAGAGVAARAVALYETVATPVPADLIAALDQLHGVLVHSPRAARRLAEVLGGEGAPRLRVYGLSPQVAAALAGAAIGPVITAPLPNEDALLSLLS